MGPPMEAETWLSASGMSTGLMTWSVVGVTQLATDGGQKLFVEKLSACMPPGRTRNSPSPCIVLVPDLVTMFRAGPAVQPNSEENAFESTLISWMAPIGTRGNRGLPAPRFVVVGTVDSDGGGAA